MKFTIFGNPVAHSKSPQMHNAGFEYINFNGNYTKTLLEDGTKIKQVFLDNAFQGANITVPHKEIAYQQANEVVGLACKIGAVNTYINKNGIIKAYNTDASGFMMAIEEFGTIKSVLLLGAGGTARAIAVALTEQNIKVTILNRSSKRKDFFVDISCAFYDWDTFDITESYDLVVNSTSAGLKDDNYPAPLDILNTLLLSSKCAFDCIYGKLTPFLSLAKTHNLPYKDGEDMLLYQGVLAFELFTGIKSDKDLIGAMRQGLKS